MKNLIQLHDRIINKDYIYYAEKDSKNNKLIINTPIKNMVVSFRSNARFIRGTNFLRRVGFIDIESKLINSDKIFELYSYKENENEYIHIIFDNNQYLDILLTEYKLKDTLNDIALMLSDEMSNDNIFPLLDNKI